MNFWDRIVEKGFIVTFKNKKKTLIVSTLIVVVTFFSGKFLGTEFLPQLNEGALWITAELPMSYSQPESVKIANTLRKELMKFPEVVKVISQEGRSNDGTDPNGFNFVQF